MLSGATAPHEPIPSAYYAVTRMRLPSLALAHSGARRAQQDGFVRSTQIPSYYSTAAQATRLWGDMASTRRRRGAGNLRLHSTVETNMTEHDQAGGRRTFAAPGLIRTIRRPELKLIVPLADSTIYEMEQRGEFPRRFCLSPRCVVWDLAEVQAWVEARRAESRAGVRSADHPDVRLRRTRPVRS